MRKLIFLVIVSIFFISCSQNTVKEDEKNTNNEQPAKTVKKAEVAKKSEPVKKEKKIVVPKEVSDKYKSLIIEITHLNTNKTVETNILIGQKAEIAGTPLVIELEAYLPDFTMKDNSVMTSKSADENNPAAKVKIYKYNQLVFDGWLFKNFPDTHSFEDPDYKLLIKNAVIK